MSDLISYRLEDEHCWRLSADRLPDVLQSHATKVDGLPGLGDCMRRLVEMLVDNDFDSLKLDRAAELGGCVILVMDRRNARVARTRIDKYGLDSDSFAEGFLFRDPELEDDGTEGIHACIRFLSQQFGHLTSHDDKLIIVSAIAGTGDLTNDAPYWPNGGD